MPEGFTPYVTTSRHPLVAILLSDGPPNETYWLAPESYLDQGKVLVAKWRFIPGPRPIWISCSYAKTSVVLAFALPLATTQCEVPFDTTSFPHIATTFTCK